MSHPCVRTTEPTNVDETITNLQALQLGVAGWAMAHPKFWLNHEWATIRLASQ